MNRTNGLIPRSSRLSRVAVRLVASLISISVGLFICELIVRRVAPQVVSVNTIDTVEGIYCQPVGVRGRQSIPGQFDVAYETSSQRFRSPREFSQEPQPGVKRIVAIGDSFTFGMGSNFAETFPASLEALLAESGERLEVINAGSMNTGTGMQALWYDRWVSRFHPHVVVLTVYANDMEDDLSEPVFELNWAGEAVPCSPQAISDRLKPSLRYSALPLRRFLCEHSHLANLLKRVATHLLTDKPVENIGSSLALRRELFENRGVRLMRGELAWLKQRVEASGARLVVLWCPPRETIYLEAGPAAEEMRWQAALIRQTLERFTREQGVPFRDLTDVFLTESHSMSTELYYKVLDRHLKPAANQLIAREAGSLLRSHPEFETLVRGVDPKSERPRSGTKVN